MKDNAKDVVLVVATIPAQDLAKKDVKAVAVLFVISHAFKVVVAIVFIVKSNNSFYQCVTYEKTKIKRVTITEGFFKHMVSATLPIFVQQFLRRIM